MRSRRRTGQPRLEAIELRDASVRLGRQWALRDVSFAVRSGERWVVTGANGAGKTVLLRLLRGELWPTPTGRERRFYRLGGEVEDPPAAARARIAYLGPERQDRYERYGWDLRVSDVVGTGLFDTDIPLDVVDAYGRRSIRRVLEDAGLAGLAERRFLGLSYGQRRRVLLARALVGRPDVLLLDEALNGLDAHSRRAFLRQLHRGARPRTAWVLATHREGDVPRGATHCARLEDGRVVESGPAPGARGVRTRTAKIRPGIESRGDPGRAHGPRPASASRDDLLRVRNATVYRDGRAVIRRLDWSLRAGEHWCITGPNGSGKSTLVAVVYGDLWPADGGRIERPVLEAHAPIDDWKREVGLVSPELQATYAATGCTVEEIVLSGLHSSIGLNDLPGPEETRAARRALANLGLLALRSRRARELSYGQLRRALFARATVRPRRLLLLDEPYDGLDAPTRRRLQARVNDAVRGGTQLVVATHHPEDVPTFVGRELRLDGRGGVAIGARLSARGAAAASGSRPRARRAVRRPG